MKRNAHSKLQLTGGLSLNILTDEDVKKIHRGTLEVLDQTGVFVEDETALDCFESGGARVDRESKMVQIPPHLVEEAIRSAPSSVTLAGRDPKHDLVLEGDRVHFTNFSEGVKVNDPYTGENRPPVKQDLVDSARVIDYLDEVDFCEKALGAH
ncbi:MAG: trimethylamine methyltransferase family protein, partial [Phycisphaeraceae bacterium]|nr:trimethylamine methyltransferase family protein [Phycisphaeraceae bacterium]